MSNDKIKSKTLDENRKVNKDGTFYFLGSLPGDFDTTVNPSGQNGNFPSFGTGGINGGGSGATGFPTGGSNFDEVPNGGFGGNGVNGGNGGPGTQFGGGNGVTGPGADFGSNGIGGNGFGPNGGGGGFPGGVPGGTDDGDNAIDTGESDDVNCDYLGTCYDGENIILDVSRILNDVFCFSIRPLQRYQDCCQCWYKQTLQWQNICFGSIRDLQCGCY